MRMVAAIAARRFSRRAQRNPDAAPAAWRALVLRWRNRKRIPSAIAARPALPSVSVSWTAHHHPKFWLGRIWNSYTREHVLARNSTMTIWRKARGHTLSTSPRWPGDRLVVRERNAPGGERTSPALRRAMLRRARPGVPAAIIARSLRQMELRLHSVLRVASIHVVVTKPIAREGVRGARAPASHTAAVPLRWAALGRGTRNGLEFRKQNSSAHRAGPHTPISAPLPPPAIRPPELTWRTSQRQDSTSAQVFALAEHSGAPPSSPRPATAAAAALGGASPAGDSIARLPPDPAFVERIAEDVIRRVQRHARIERERRGV
jgi:hypothetical protein